MKWPWTKDPPPPEPIRSYCFLNGNDSWTAAFKAKTALEALPKWIRACGDSWVQDPIEKAYVVETKEFVNLHCRYLGPNTIPNITFEEPETPFVRYGKERAKKKKD